MDAIFFTPQNIHLAQEHYQLKINNSEKNFKQVFHKELIRKLFYHLITLRLRPLPNELINLQNLKNILLVRNDGIGDWILSTPIVDYIKEINPKINIDVISSYRNYELVKGNPLIKNVYPIHHKPTLLELFKIGLKIRKANTYDLIILLKHTETTKNLIFTRIASRKNTPIIAFGHSLPLRHSTYQLAFSNATNMNSSATHWSEVMMDLVRANIKPEPYSYISPTVNFSKSNFDNISNIIQTNNLEYCADKEILNFDFETFPLSNPMKYAIFNISSFNPNKHLNEICIIELINTILEQLPNMMLFLSGSENDSERIEQLVSKINKSNCKGIYLDLMDYVAFLAGASCIISPDSGPVHIASVFNKPVIAFYKSYEKLVHWHPLSARYVAILKDNISEITKEELIKAFQLLKIQ